MANTKLSALSEALSAASNDVLYLVDVSDDTQSPEGTGKKITKENLLGSNFDTIQITEGTTSANGINFGSDVTLYRSGADTLTTDDNMNILGGVLNMGVADSQAGLITLYGSATASDEGGQINLNVAADYDTSFETWSIDAYQDDLRFFRSDAGVVNQMTAEGMLQLSAQGSAGGLLIGGDTQIYRASANTIFTGNGDNFNVVQTDANSATYSSWVSGDSVARFRVLGSGYLQWGSGSATPDVNLYRESANALRTDDQFTANLDITTVQQFKLFTAGQKLLFSSTNGAYDVNLYADGANTLKTDDNFEANSVKIFADLGSGEASTTTLTNATDTPTTDPGWASSSTVNMNAPDGYIKIYVGTSAVVVPFWNT